MSTVNRHSSKSGEVLDVCREKLLQAAPGIIDALIVEAREGSYQHAKFLFDLLETPSRKPNHDDEDELPGPSLAEMLIERLQLEPPRSDSTDTPGSTSAA